MLHEKEISNQASENQVRPQMFKLSCALTKIESEEQAKKQEKRLKKTELIIRKVPASRLVHRNWPLLLGARILHHALLFSDQSRALATASHS